MSKKGRVWIGTSGWNYKHWKEAFYPSGVTARDFLSYYATHLSSVEVNKSFYRLLAPKETTTWTKQTPANFCFAVKGSRFITHMLKLKKPALPVKRFFSPLKKLGEKMGPVLFQFPPNWDKNVDRFTAFLDVLPPGIRYAFEFRDRRWISDDVLSLIKERKMAFCIYDFDGYASPRHVTAPFVYIRLHGPGQRYQGAYDAATLKNWFEWIAEQREKGCDAYCFFDNDQKAYAVQNARDLQKMFDRT